MFANFGSNITRALTKYWGLFLEGIGITLLLSLLQFFGTIIRLF